MYVAFFISWSESIIYFLKKYYICKDSKQTNTKYYFMKFKSLFFAAIAAVFSFASCEEMGKDQDLGSPALTVNATELSFEEAGGDQSVILNSTRDWRVTSSAEWVVVDPASGKASADDQTVVVSATLNEGGNRNATLTFTNGMVTKIVKVSQVGTGVTAPEEGITSIADVLKSTGALAEGTVIKGIVVSNLELNNLTSKKGMYVQDETGALQFYLSDNHEFAVGTEVKIDLSGVSVGAYNGAVQVSGLALAKITTVSTGNALVAKTVTMADFLANKYEGQYVALEGVQVKESDLSKTWVEGGAHTSINFEDANGNSFVVFSSKYATYGAQTVAQGSGTIKGISSINNGKMQIIFAQASDYAGLTGARFEGAEVTPPTGGEDEGGETPVTGQPTDLVKATVAEFLAAAESSDVWYELSGEIDNIANTTYGNFTIKDATGEVLIYGMTSKWVGSNDKSFSQIGLKVGDTVTLGTLRSSYNGTPQGGGNTVPAFYLSHVPGEGGEEPVTPPAGGDGQYDSNITWTLGANAYDKTSTAAQTALVNNVSVSNLLKLGKGDAAGDATINVPAGTKKIGFYAVAWKGKSNSQVKFSTNGTEITTITPKANDGATGNPKYTLTLTDADYYIVNVPEGATAIKVETTSSSQGRVMFIGIKALTE